MYLFKDEAALMHWCIRAYMLLFVAFYVYSQCTNRCLSRCYCEVNLK